MELKNEELKGLIDSALIDGHLSKKEREVIFRKAESLGVNLDELEIYLEALKYKNKKSRFTFLNTVVYKREAGTKTVQKTDIKNQFKSVFSGEKEYEEVPVKAITIRLWYILLPLVVLGVFFVYLLLRPTSITIDECLAKYDYETARELVNNMHCWDESTCPRTTQLAKIIQQEAYFLVNNDQFEKAITVAGELKSLVYYDKLLENGEISNSAEELIDDLCKSIIMKQISNPAEYTKNQAKAVLLNVNNKELKIELATLVDESFN